jgi:hypothetical protein
MIYAAAAGFGSMVIGHDRLTGVRAGFGRTGSRTDAAIVSTEVTGDGRQGAGWRPRQLEISVCEPATIDVQRMSGYEARLFA